MGDLSWRFDDREYSYIKEVLDSGFASGTSGNMNTRLENKFSEIMGTKYSVSFNSGTTTLHAALVSFGVGYGDEVLVTPLTVISCMNAILYCNAIPVFVDVDPDTFLMDPKDMERKITSKTKAVMPVHLYGQVCDMTEIMRLADKYSLKVLEDCAQCYLGEHRGKVAGTIGHVGSWSFENSKQITTGDGGIITCNDEKLADLIRKLGCQGFRNATAVSGKIRVSKDIFQNPMYKRHNKFGFMYRLPEVAAALGLAQLEKIDWFIKKREQMANMYEQVLELTNCNWLIPQQTQIGDRNTYYAFAVKIIRDDIEWEDFRKEYIKNGGDGIYSAWALCYREDSIDDIKLMLDSMNLKNRLNTDIGQCPNAEKIQSQLMQFTTNQKDEDEMQLQADALLKTIKGFS